jgi:hypothetical protein
VKYVHLSLLLSLILPTVKSLLWGQQVRQYNVEERGVLYGISLAIDCGGNMYFATSAVSAIMFVWHDYPAGPVTALPLLDSNRTELTIAEVSWDAGRGLFWGSTGYPSFGDGVGIYTITTTGFCTFQFRVDDTSWPFGGADGLAYDPDSTWPGGSLWLSWDQNNYALHYTTTGDFISRVELPMEDTNPDNISGICAVPNGLWCARMGVDYHCITFHRKDGGPPLPGFTIDTSPLFMIEGLECEHNPVGFPDGTCVLWVKDVSSPQTVTAYRISAGSCGCTADSNRR